MKTEFLNFLKKEISQVPQSLDRVIVSAFIISNKIKVEQNVFVRSYIIEDSNKNEVKMLLGFLEAFDVQKGEFDFETLIELFEFVMSPSDKVVNGAIYTPKYIRDYIVNNCIAVFPGNLAEVKAADISCGCGGFLLSLAQKIHEVSGKYYKDIFRENLFGVDIASYSIDRTKILLSLFALINGEDEKEFEFNLYTGDSLTFNWKEISPEIALMGGFDIIVGNPPYVCSRNMDKKTIELLKSWEVSKTGHPDLYIPFFQIGLENLNRRGILGYITVNTFIKSINGRALRKYFAGNDINLTLITFGGEQVFLDRNTYTCVCFLKHGKGQINFLRTQSSELSNIDLTALHQYQYADLDHNSGWNLVNDINLLNFIKVIENTGIQFKDRYNTKNGIATLKNEVYKFNPVDEDENYYYLQDDEYIYPIEIEICRRIINANKLKTEADIDRLEEQIIFPYDPTIKIIPENIMETDYPGAYAYLQDKREILSHRDKGNGEYEEWYAYGRRQSMDIHAYKLFFPHICDRPKFVICDELDLLFYNGIAIVSDNLDDLIIIKKVMESDLFFRYISNTTKDYASGYISMSRNYLKNFGVYQFNERQREQLLGMDNANEINRYLEDLYNVHPH